MRKGLPLLMIVLLFHVFFSGIVFGADIKVVINGQEKSFSPEPVIKNSSTLVPMRAFFEALGCKVEWDNPTRTAIGKRDNKEVRLTIGSKEAFVDGQKRELSVEAQLINGSTFIPLRFVGEALGEKVEWNGTTRTITISSSTQVPESFNAKVTTLNVGGTGQYRSIQDAINAAQPGTTIQVTQGQYFENIKITGTKDISIQGGWNDDFSSRCSDNSFTVIDGNGLGSVLNITADANESICITIDGLTIRKGTAEAGGGIYATAFGSGSMINLILSKNSITGNHAEVEGAGILAKATGAGSKISLHLNENHICDNASNDKAGGIAITTYGGSINAVLLDNSITENTANNFGAGVMIVGNDNASLNVNIRENTVRGNIVTRLLPQGDGMDGGGFVIYGSGSSTRMKVAIANNIIVGNEAPFGGGIFGHAHGNAEITVTMANNLVFENTARMSGGSIFSLSGATNASEKPGGTINWNLTNNTLCCNISKRDSPGIGSNTAAGGSTVISSRNDIIWGNTELDGAGPQVNLANVGGDANSITFRASYSNIPSVNAFRGASIDMENVLEENPLFIDTASGNFLLQDVSPCIDMGDPGADYCDGSRPPARGTERNDMGAYGGPQNNKWPTSS